MEPILLSMGAMLVIAFLLLVGPLALLLGRDSRLDGDRGRPWV